MRISVFIVLLFATTLTAFAQTPDEQALLRLHARDRVAHLKGDANLLTADMAPEIVDVGRGEFKRTTRGEVRKHFTDYFKQAKYSAFNDMTAPIIHISADGRSAFMAVQVHMNITMTQTGKPPEHIEAQHAWLATYEKHNGKWAMTAIGYSVPTGK